MPRRIQRQRTKGWRMPEAAVYVGRPTKWGNPWAVADIIGADIDAPGPYRGAGAIVTPDLAVRLFQSALIFPGRVGRVRTGLRITAGDVVRELSGKDLVCWCAIGQPCHADVLLEIANDVLPQSLAIRLEGLAPIQGMHDR